MSNEESIVLHGLQGSLRHAEEEVVEVGAQSEHWHMEAQLSSGKCAELQMSLQQSRRQWENASEKLGGFESQCITLRSEAHSTCAELKEQTKDLQRLRTELSMHACQSSMS